MERVINLSDYLPRDALPTLKYLSTLPGFETPEPNVWPTNCYPRWRGVTDVDGMPVQISIASMFRETTIELFYQTFSSVHESWDLYESHDTFSAGLMILDIPVSVLNPGVRSRYSSHPSRSIYNLKLKFDQGAEQTVLPIRRRSQIDLAGSTASAGWTLEQGIDTLMNLKNLIERATFIPFDENSPDPFTLLK